MAGIGSRVAIGAGWMMMMRFADRGIGLVSTAVLARLLLPRDFGLVALAVSLIAILDLVGELSVELALIQNQHADRRHYDTAWTLNVLKGLVFAGLLCALARPAGDFFNEPQVIGLVYWLALTPLIAGFENIGVVDFRKQLEFHREFTWVTTSRIVATVVTIALAFAWRDASALVAGMIVRRLVSLVLSYRLHPYRPRFALDGFTELFRFSRWVMIENVLTAIRLRSPSFVLGRVAGANALGYYSMAYEIAMMASSEIEQPIRRAVFPGYAKVASNPGLLRAAFLDVFGMMTLLGAPVAVGVGVIAPLVVPLFLGAQWLDVIPLMQILSVFGLLVVLAGGTRIVYLALNKPYIATALSAVDAIVLLPLTVIGAMTAGAVGMAWAMVVTAAVTCGTSIVVVMRFLDIPFAAITGRVWRVVLGLTAIVLAVTAVDSVWQTADRLEEMLKLLACVAAAVAVYAGTVGGLWLAGGREDAAEAYVARAVRAALRRLTTARAGVRADALEEERDAAR